MVSKLCTTVRRGGSAAMTSQRLAADLVDRCTRLGLYSLIFSATPIAVNALGETCTLAKRSPQHRVSRPVTTVTEGSKDHAVRCLVGAMSHGARLVPASDAHEAKNQFLYSTVSSLTPRPVVTTLPQSEKTSVRALVVAIDLLVLDSWSQCLGLLLRQLHWVR